MKLYVRGVAAVVLVIVLSIQVAPVAAAAPRDSDDIPTKIVRVLQRIQRFLKIFPLDSAIAPPTP